MTKARRTRKENSQSLLLHISQHGLDNSNLSENVETNKAYLRFDSSVGRGDLITPIGVGRVILGPFFSLSASDQLRIKCILPTALHVN